MMAKVCVRVFVIFNEGESFLMLKYETRICLFWTDYCRRTQGHMHLHTRAQNTHFSEHTHISHAWIWKGSSTKRGKIVSLMHTRKFMMYVLHIIIYWTLPQLHTHTHKHTYVAAVTPLHAHRVWNPLKPLQPNLCMVHWFKSVHLFQLTEEQSASVKKYSRRSLPLWRIQLTFV